MANLPPPGTYPIDGAWFRARLKDAGRTQRGLAKHLDLDPSAMTHLFAGRRRMTLAEAPRVARFLNVTTEDILRAAGLKGIEGGQPRAVANGLPIVGTIDGKSRIRPMEPQHSVHPTPPAPPGTVALRVTASAHPLYGAAVFYHPSDVIDPGAVWRWAIVQPATGDACLCRLERGLGEGLFNLAPLVPVHDDDRAEGVEIRSASPVLWIRF